MIGIVDYNMGNIRSVRNALLRIGEECTTVRTPNEIEQMDAVVLPGVGAFGAMMRHLDKLRIRDSLVNWIEDGNKFLGICLGYQALFEESEENPGVSGLGVLSGKVMKFRQGRIPQVGWNRVTPVGESIIPEGNYYFVNSYFPQPEEEKVAATTSYHREFASAVSTKNLLATQFHPERSGELGLELLRRWSCA